jgi:hypothetical protein
MIEKGDKVIYVWRDEDPKCDVLVVESFDWGRVRYKNSAGSESIETFLAIHDIVCVVHINNLDTWSIL